MPQLRSRFLRMTDRGHRCQRISKCNSGRAIKHEHIGTMAGGRHTRRGGSKRLCRTLIRHSDVLRAARRKGGDRSGIFTRARFHLDRLRGSSIQFRACLFGHSRSGHSTARQRVHHQNARMMRILTLRSAHGKCHLSPPPGERCFVHSTSGRRSHSPTENVGEPQSPGTAQPGSPQETNMQPWWSGRRYIAGTLA